MEVGESMAGGGFHKPSLKASLAGKHARSGHRGNYLQQKMGAAPAPPPPVCDTEFGFSCGVKAGVP